MGNVLNEERSPDFIKKEKESSDASVRRSFSAYHSAIKSVKGNEQIIIEYNIKSVGHYKSYLYSITTKKCISVAIEYPIKDGKKKKAGEILNGISESVNFK